MKWQKKFFPLLSLLVMLLSACVAPIAPVAPEGGAIVEDSSSPEEIAGPEESSVEETVVPEETIVAEEPANSEVTADTPPPAFSMETDNCILNVDGGGYNSSGGVAGDIEPPPGEDPTPLHGSLVWSTVAMALQTTDESGTSLAERVTLAHYYSGILTEDYISEEQLTVILIVDQFSHPNNDERRSGRSLWQVHDADSTSPKGFIIVEIVDIQDFDVAAATWVTTNAIAGYKTESTVNFFDQDGQNPVSITIPPAHKFVINMSWLVVPCDDIPQTVDQFIFELCEVATFDEQIAFNDLMSVQRLFETISFSSFEEFCGMSQAGIADNLASASQYSLNEFLLTRQLTRVWLRGVDSDGELNSRVINPLDPLFQFIQCLGDISGEQCVAFRDIIGYDGDHQFISIAAAGNSGKPYPFVPALLDSVVSVSADDAVPIGSSFDPRFEYQSNLGEVKLSGLHHALDKNLGGAAPIQGTSFAAPRLSVLAALYLLDGGSARCDGFLPTLGYVDGAIKNAGTLEDLPWQDAASTYCQDFLPLLDYVSPTVLNQIGLPPQP